MPPNQSPEPLERFGKLRKELDRVVKRWIKNLFLMLACTGRCVYHSVVASGFLLKEMSYGFFNHG
jgi:hypothetical protein